MTFLDCLFNKDEYTCFSATPKGIKIFPVYNGYTKQDAFFSINPMDPTKTRADSSVLYGRNILVESDKLPIEQQEQYITEIGMPYSTAVYSGSKSIHFIISLEEPLSNESTYRAIVKRIYKAIGNELVDQNCKNISRFSRLPGHIRVDTGKEQKLLRVGRRVPNAELEAWLIKRGAPAEEAWENLTPEKRSEYKNPSRLRGSTKNFLMFGAEKGLWNAQLFKAAADLCRCGYEIDEAEGELIKITGSLDYTDRRTISSAFKSELEKDHA